jgi:hypothetical protein
MLILFWERKWLCSFEHRVNSRSGFLAKAKEGKKRPKMALFFINSQL